MRTYIIPMMIMSCLASGCATEEPSTPISVNGASPKVEQVSDQETGFQDVSLSSQRRFHVLTNKMEVEREIRNFVSNGQADVITRPDGTILFPYGLASAGLTAKRMMYSKIVLQEGEKIVSAAAGDTTRWNILPGYIGNAVDFTPVVLIKPFMGGLQTSLSIITDRRDYDISIRSVDAGDYMQRIGFYYPQEKADLINMFPPPESPEGGESKQPRIDFENIKYDYKISGDRRLSWYPAGAFEDGRKVFIKMPDHVDRSQLPVFMALDPVGRTELVNYRYFRPYFVIDTIFERGVLMLGTDKVREMVKITKV